MTDLYEFPSLYCTNESSLGHSRALLRTNLIKVNMQEYDMESRITQSLQMLNNTIKEALTELRTEEDQFKLERSSSKLANELNQIRNLIHEIDDKRPQKEILIRKLDSLRREKEMQVDLLHRLEPKVDEIDMIID